MRKKCFRRRVVKAMIPLLGIAAAGMAVCTPVTAFAEESVITQERVDELKAAYEQAQAEYDAAKKSQQAARDVVVNAERARDEAQEKYEEVLERYHTGAAGFLQWVIENGNTDTWEEEFKVAEAMQTLADLKLPGYESFLEDQSPGLFSFYDINADIMGTAESTTNLTRMYYSLDWMEAINNNAAAKNLPEIKTSHGAMMTAMDFATFISGYYSGNMNEVVDFKEMDVQDMYDFYGGARFYYMLLSDKNVQVSEDGIPEMDHYSDVFPEELYNLTVQEKEATEYDEENDRYTWGNPYEFEAENPVMGFARGSSKQGDFVVWVVAEEYMSNFLPTYTLDEYIKALRDYYSITNPDTSKLAIITAENDIADAQKELDMADEWYSASAAKLKDAEKEYEEAAVLLEKMPVFSRLPKTDETVIREAADETETAMVIEASDRIETATVIEASDETETKAVFEAVDGTETATVIEASDRTETATVFERVDESVTAAVIERVAGSETVMDVKEALEPESNIISYEASVKEGVIVSEEAAVNDGVKASDEALVNDGVIASDEALVKAETVVNDETPVKDNTEVKEKGEKNKILAEVLSYIFNGGAIALIIPTGLKRRKKGAEEIFI